MQNYACFLFFPVIWLVMKDLCKTELECSNIFPINEDGERASNKGKIQTLISSLQVV